MIAISPAPAAIPVPLRSGGTIGGPESSGRHTFPRAPIIERELHTIVPMTELGTVNQRLVRMVRGVGRLPVARPLLVPPGLPVFGGTPGSRLALRGQIHEVAPAALVVPLVSPRCLRYL